MKSAPGSIGFWCRQHAFRRRLALIFILLVPPCPPQHMRQTSATWWMALICKRQAMPWTTHERSKWQAEKRPKGWQHLDVTSQNRPCFQRKDFSDTTQDQFFCALPFFGWFDVPYSTTDTFDVDGHFRCGSHVPRVWDSFLLHSCWISQDDSRCAVPTKKTMCDWMPFQGAKFWGNTF